MHSAATRVIGIGGAVLAAVLAAGCGAQAEGGADLLSGGDPNRGGQVFANNCAQCHGTDLNGTDQGPPLLHPYYVPSHHADVAFLLAVQRGVQPHHWDFGPMPPVPDLAASDVADVVAYVREQQRQAGLIE